VALQRLRFEIRAATPEDEEQLLKLSQYLNTVNLPHDRPHVRRLLDQSQRSFTGEIADCRFRKYVFVIWDLEQEALAGTSMVVAQFGRRDAPYIYLDVIADEKYSATLDKHFHHTVLRLGFSYDGPTEVGGLVVAPEYRRDSEKLGLLVSYVRFLFIAAHRNLFQEEILAELLPPLEPDGRSHLWEAFGRRFTNMTYAEADLRSSEDKAFIRDLFPGGDIYTTLFSPEAQAVIGKVGPQTRGVEKMLQRIGFRYAERIDPFDGGPHFTARTEDIGLVRHTHRMRFAGPMSRSLSSRRGLVARETTEPPYFRAVATQLSFDGQGMLRISEQAAAHLAASVGEELVALELP
jgi:arginine N-succinyltransferase